MIDRSGAPRAPVLSDDCWRLLDFLRNRGWQCPAAVLMRGYGGCNYRARVSDLRLQFGLGIQADPGDGIPSPAASQGSACAPLSVAVPRHRVGIQAIYKVPAQFIPLAEHLWRYKSRAGYFPANRQVEAFR